MFIEVRNPATGEYSGKVAAATAGDVAEAAERARKAQRAWGGLAFRDRASIIRRFHDLILDSRNRILDTIQSETGKTRRDALGEVVTVAMTARYYLAHGRRILADKRRDGAAPLITSSEIVYKPHGVVGLITPWNYPFILSAGDTLPALLAGNAVVIKPSELTPLSAALSRELLVQSGLPPDLFIIVNGTGEVGAELIKHVDYVGFTGGTATGRKIAVAAAGRLIPYSLELGGKNPMVVLDGAPLDDVARGVLTGAFSNTGQTCISVERIYVQDSIYEDFTRRVVEKTKRMKLGFDRTWDIDMGSLISETHAQKVMRHIEGALAQGARLLTGGKQRKDLGPAFVEPTILTDVGDDMAMHREETFGPVVALYPVRSAEEAVARANDSEFGLNASVWAKNAGQARQIARRIESGTACVNSTLLIYNSLDVPMGGVKQSGIGRRHGEQGILRYTQAQSIVTSTAFRGGYDSLTLALTSDRVAASLAKLLKLWRRL